MKVNKGNSEFIISNMRYDGQHSRADYLTLMQKKIDMLTKIYKAISELPFGESPALPWCREAFTNLDDAMNKYKKWSENKN
jgi:hypothetical protein